MATYTTIAEYKAFWGESVSEPNPYEVREDLAIIVLEATSFAFPTLEEYTALEDGYSKDCLKKAIFCQIKYREDNPDIFDNAVGGGSYSMGRVSVTNASYTVEEREKLKLSPDAKEYLFASGFVETGVYVDHDCGCDLTGVL